MDRAVPWLLLAAVVLALYGASGLWLDTHCWNRCGKGLLEKYSASPYDGCICEGERYLMRPPVLSGERGILRAGEDTEGK